MEIRLEPATEADLRPLLFFAEWTFRHAYQALNDPDDFENYMVEHFTEAHFLIELAAPESQFWLAKNSENELVGYLKINQNRLHDAVEETLKTTGRMTELERIYVHPDWKGHRIGQKLLEKADSLAIENGSDWLWLGVWSRNEAAQRFYEKAGFEKFGQHIFVLGDEPQMDWVMRRPIGKEGKSGC